MKILFPAHTISFPPNKGEKAHAYPMLAQLLRHSVSMAYRVDSPDDIAGAARNRVLDAMNVGVPVVATFEAVKGIQLTKEDEVLIGDGPEKFAARIGLVLSESALYERLASNARSRVMQCYSWKGVAAQLDEIILDRGKCVSRGWQSSGPASQVSL